MNTKQDGGAAFPNVEYVQSAGGGAHLMAITGGMSLRDYFAAKAMPVFVAQDWDDNICAEKAYRIADAMLAAREAK